MVRPIFPGAGAPRFALAFGCGESGGSTSVAGVGLPSVAGIGGSGSRFGCGASPVLAAVGFTMSRLVIGACPGALRRSVPTRSSGRNAREERRFRNT